MLRKNKLIAVVLAALFMLFSISGVVLAQTSAKDKAEPKLWSFDQNREHRYLWYGDFDFYNKSFADLTTFTGTVIGNGLLNQFSATGGGAATGLLTLSTIGTPQLVFNDSDAADDQSPFWYMHSANNASKGIFYFGRGDRSSGITMTGYTDVMIVDETSFTFGSTINVGSMALYTGTITTVGDVQIDGTASGLDMQGAYTSAAIDLTDVVLDYSGSSGPVMIRAGTYGSPVSSADPHQSGMIRLYGTNSATVDDGTGFYDRGIFVNHQITGNKSAFPIAGLVEVRDVGGEAGPVAIQAAQFIVGLHTSTAKLAATASVTDGMFGSWNKVYSVTGSVAAATSRVAPIWCDNQMSGTVSGEEYGIFATTGGTRPDGFIGFETTSSGYDQFIYCDATFNSGAGTMITTDAVPGTQDARIKIYYNGTQYYLALYR